MSNFKDDEVKERKKFPLLHIGLFITTFITCLMAGTQWSYHDWSEVLNWHYGLTYAILILTFLSAHEFGHYFAAKLHKVKATLPYYIPFPFTFALNFGTLGAVIKMKSRIPNKKVLFDIGVAGPIAGFVVAVSFLIYGFATLPGVAHLYTIHPEYISQNSGNIPITGLYFGDTILYTILSNIFTNPNAFLPPMNEMYHYPFLNVGWFGLFVTTLNMLPMGQLDGGHIIYAMFGDRIHAKIAKFTFYTLLVFGVFSMIGLFHDFLKIIPSNDSLYYLHEDYFPATNRIYNIFPLAFKGWSGWLLWALLAKFVIKLQHPPTDSDEPLSKGRMVVGFIAIIILILSFSYMGIYLVDTHNM
ncbi:MAG TPA: site-2 protease family protein [Candidatus Kapabacteria bacterium]|nr:site-2 protease family protein [Candidatus Kapabacteria bacterium]